MSEYKKGLLAGIFCFVFWGFAPVFFKLIQSISALSIISHRLIWGALFLLIFLSVREKNNLFNALKVSYKQLGTLFISGALVISNWLVFVWAVNSGQILATALGYFINPLVNILLGVLFLNENLNTAQKWALAIASASTLFLGIYLGQPPWIALFLAGTFGLYGLVRKKLDVRPLIGLFWETLIFCTPAIIYLYFYASEIPQNDSTFQIKALLVLAGLVTILPLVGFNYATKRLPLSVVGFLQYLGPTISFIIAVNFYGEIFSLGHKIAFAGIWLALIIVSWSSFKKLFKSK